MDIIKIVIRIEADKIDGDSKVFLNGAQLSKEEIERSEILYDIVEDDSYTSVDLPELDKCYKHKNDKGNTTYIVYGNLNDKDECNRRLAFSALLEGKQITESSLLNILSSEFRKINYNFSSNCSCPPKMGDKDKNITLNSSNHTKKFCFNSFVVISIIFFILILFLTFIIL